LALPGKTPLKYRGIIPAWNEQHWQMLKNLKVLMSPLVLVISLLEGDKYPTQSLILTLLLLLEENVVQMQDEYLDKSDEFAKFF